MHNYSPQKKFSRPQLYEDYDLLKKILEEFHPSLYWYTSKDSMDYFFAQQRAAISDSMTEQQFGFRILAPLTTQIRCGHTSFNFSKQYTRFFDSRALPSFPLNFKIWGDTMIVTSNMNRKDSMIKRGTQLLSVNGMNARKLADTMFRYLPTDGYAENLNYIRLSGSFPYYHRNIFGLTRQYRIDYLDSNNIQKQATVPVYIPDTTSAGRIRVTQSVKRSPGEIKKARRENVRSLEIDTALHLAVMTVNSFDGGGKLKKFYKTSFKKIKKEKIHHLVVDIRSNGGGKVNYYTRLARYIRPTPFKVADTAVSIRKNFKNFGKYFQNTFLNSVALFLFTSKYKDGRYHLRYWENHVYKPKKQYHYNGNVYVLINGPTFSASTLFCHTVKGLENVTLIGEETGGGHHGNNGLMIPYVTLPNTRMRIRVPMFRLVQYNHIPKNGRGVLPDIYVPPSAYAIRNGIDLKMEKVRQLVREKETISIR
jgi:Peptidase family S41